MGPQKIILFGGTFDPPHNGHMTLLAGAIEAVRPDLVLVEPAGTPPHKRAAAHPPPTVSPCASASARCFRSWCWIPRRSRAAAKAIPLIPCGR